MSDGETAQIKVRCPCGVKLKMPAAAAGRKAKCPKCRQVFTVPASTPTRATPEPVTEPEDSGSLLDELVVEQQSAAPASPSAPEPRSTTCPHCGATTPPEAVLCVSCGYDQRTGRSLKAASAQRAAIGGALRWVAARASTFAAGCALSGVGALLGAIVWCVVAVITEYEIGWIALGLGVLAGLGMKLGYREPNQRAGVTAACIAVLGILGAKLTVFGYVSYPELKKVTAEIALIGDEGAMERSQLASHYADLEAQRRGLSYVEPDRETLYDRELENMDSWSEAEVAAALAELEVWEAGGKWEDDEYVRSFLIYAMVDETLEDEDSAEFPEPTPSEWRRMYTEAVAEVDALSLEQQLERTKDIEHQRDREAKAMRLAWHRAERREMAMGLSYTDQRQDSLFEEELQANQQRPDQELNTAIAELDAWEGGGKWQDADYVRNTLIYGHIDEAMEKQAGPEPGHRT